METEVVLITPKIADELLRKNKTNRKVQQAVVDQYARDMRNQRWATTHQGILLGAEDCVIDGQHRLLAIVKSGVHQRMMVTRDERLVSPLDLPIDTGSKRSHAFILGVDVALAALARFSLSITSIHRSFSESDIAPLCSLYEGPLYELRGGMKQAKRGITTSGVFLAGVTKIMLGEDAEFVRVTLNSLITDKFSEMSPIASSFYKQVVVDRIAFDQRQLLSRAMRVFDKKQSRTSRLSIPNETSAFESARGLVIDAIELSNTKGAKLWHR